MEDTETAIEILKDARKRIEPSENWCVRMAAKDAMGKSCVSWKEKACRWCALGSLDKSVFLFTRTTKKDIDWFETPDTELRGACRTWLKRKGRNQTGPSITVVNDNHGHAAILECFDIAIANLRNELAPIKDEMEL